MGQRPRQPLFCNRLCPAWVTLTLERYRPLLDRPSVSVPFDLDCFICHALPC